MKLIDAVKLEAKCKGDSDCEGCPLAKDVKWNIFDGGIDAVGSLCSWIQLVERVLEEVDDDYKA